MRVDDFDYDLPPDRVAQAAIEPRHDARLFLPSTGRDIPFRDLATLLRPGDCLVVNTTRVRHARIRGTRSDTGGAVEFLLTRRVDEERWEAMARPSRRLRPGVTVDIGRLVAAILDGPADGVVTISLTPVDHVEDVIAAEGEIPLPPYFTGLLPDADRYQSIFARSVGSAAAPTASLHFTEDVVASVLDAGVEIAEVELQVGLDTFRPMTVRDVDDHVMHSERVVVTAAEADRVNRRRADGGRVIAVGTTVVRTLESAATETGLAPMEGATDLFITPGYRARIVDAVITNFHAPRTTLLVLIAALLGDSWRETYRTAVERDLRFLSFGDAMFFEVHRD